MAADLPVKRLKDELKMLATSNLISNPVFC
ncbi:hypothetical protein BBFGKLBO_02046 [Synechococcus sp. CBW1107]|nr:hypothetical protein BBFGKLBO_02046 [Synechococcus sp. CBW1107]